MIRSLASLSIGAPVREGCALCWAQVLGHKFRRLCGNSAGLTRREVAVIRAISNRRYDRALNISAL